MAGGGDRPRKQTLATDPRYTAGCILRVNHVDVDELHPVVVSHHIHVSPNPDGDAGGRIKEIRVGVARFVHNRRTETNGK